MVQVLSAPDISGQLQRLFFGPLSQGISSLTQGVQNRAQMQQQSQGLSDLLGIPIEQAQMIASLSPQMQTSFLNNLLSGGVDPETAELGRISGVDLAPGIEQAVPGAVGQISQADIRQSVLGDRGIAEPIINQLLGFQTGRQAIGEDRAIRQQAAADISSDPEVARVFSRQNEIQNELARINSQREQISASGALSPKTRSNELNRLTKREELLRKELDKVETPSASDIKRIDKIEEEAEKSRNGLRLIESAENLLDRKVVPKDTTSFGQLAFEPGRRARIAAGLLTEDEAELRNINLELIRGAFPTLPRIKSEFDAILSRNPSLKLSEKANRAIYNVMKQGFILNIRKAELLRQLRASGVPGKVIDNVVEKRFRAEEDRLIRQLRQETSSRGAPQQKNVQSASDILFPGGR